jgi:hypothetical protein
LPRKVKRRRLQPPIHLFFLWFYIQSLTTLTPFRLVLDKSLTVQSCKAKQTGTVVLLNSKETACGFSCLRSVLILYLKRERRGRGVIRSFQPPPPPPLTVRVKYRSVCHPCGTRACRSQSKLGGSLTVARTLYKAPASVRTPTLFVASFMMQLITRLNCRPHI